jgi:hypothetical protein
VPGARITKEAEAEAEAGAKRQRLFLSSSPSPSPGFLVFERMTMTNPGLRREQDHQTPG